MSKKVPINTQQIDYEINILVNDIVREPIINFWFGEPTYLDEKEETPILHNLNLFKIENYSDKVKSKKVNTMDKLINSIHKNLCPKEEGLQNDLKKTIPTSAFTIFINNTTSSLLYDPFCIATINKYTSNIFEIMLDKNSIVNDLRFLYIEIFCGSSEYTKCAYHLMNIIKMIASHLHYQYIVLTSVTNKHTLQWYKSQGFLKEKTTHTNNLFYYVVKDTDKHYKRSVIEGTCKIIDSSSNAECISSSSHPDSSGKSSKKSSKKSSNTSSKKSSGKSSKKIIQIK